MDPYSLLGVDRTQPLDTLEAHFRQLLHETHPDVHRASGDGAVAEAERRTRLITDAMGQIRSDYANAGTTASFASAQATVATSGAWVELRQKEIGGRVREREAVSCPHCGRSFFQLAEFQLHLTTDHTDSAAVVRRKKRSRAIPKREGKAGKTLERTLETLVLFVACIGVVGSVTFKNQLIAATGPWMAPVLVVVIVMCVFGAIGALALRRH